MGTPGTVWGQLGLHGVNGRNLTVAGVRFPAAQDQPGAQDFPDLKAKQVGISVRHPCQTDERPHEMLLGRGHFFAPRF